MAMLVAVLLPAHPAQAASLGDLFGNNSESSGQKKFLDVEEAFTVIPTLNGNELTVLMEVTPEHYIYQDKIKLKLPKGISATPFTFNQTPNYIDDPLFGEVAVFDQLQITAKTTLSKSQDYDTTTSADATATLIWQGCAKAGLCYPPQREKLSVDALPRTINATTPNVNTPNTSATLSADISPAQATPANQPQPASSNTTGVTQSKLESTTDMPSVSVTPAPILFQDQPANRINKPSLNSDTDSDDSKTVTNAASASARYTDNQDSTILGVVTSDSNLEPNHDGNSTLSPNPNSHPNSNLGTQSQSQSQLQSQLQLQSEPEPTAATDSETNLTKDTLDNSVSATAADATANSGLVHSVESNNDPFGLATHTGLAFLLLFLAGLALVFTPCVLPMLPIVSNIIAHQHKPSAIQGILLTGSYALGVSTAYGILGMLVAIFGVSLGIIGWLQHPAVLLTFAVVFAVFALYMADAFVIRAPKFFSERLGRASKLGDNYLGSMPGSFVVGLLSALVVSPCVSFPLFGALLAVSTIGNPLLGFGALFMLGLGLSSPLIILGATQANFMPKAGAWMDWVKIGFALMLFAVSLLLLERVLMSPLMLLIWAFWFLVVARWLWSWQERGTMMTKALAVLLGLWATMLVIGAAMGNQDSWQPLKGLSTKANFYDASLISPNSNGTDNNGSNHNVMTITTLDELDTLLMQNDKVLVDIVAEWCIECRIMENNLFNNPPAKLSAWQVVKLDITKADANSEAVLERYQIPGPPTLLYYVEGELQHMQVGEVARDDFESTLNNLS